MTRSATLALLLVILSAPLCSAQTPDSAAPKFDSLVTWYHTQYPFVSMTDTIYTWETEFRTPDGFHRADSTELTPFQAWVTHFPLWHRYKSVGIWKGGTALDKEEISRVVHLPWRGPVYTDRGFPLRIIAEYLRKNHRENDLVVEPRFGGDTLTYARWLKSKEGYDGRGAVKLIPATERDSSAFEFFRYLSVCMKNQTYESLAANSDSLTRDQVRPGDLVIGHDERGLTGQVFVVMNMLDNDSGDRVYAVGTGCPEACDFHIPLVGHDRDYPWLTPTQLDSLVAGYPRHGYFRLFKDQQSGT